MNASATLSGLAYIEDTDKPLFVIQPAIESSKSQTLEQTVSIIYQCCTRLNAGYEIVGDEGHTFVYDLAQRKLSIANNGGEPKLLNRISTTSFNIEGRCTSLKWEFLFEDRNEIFTMARMSLGIPENLVTGNELERIFPDTYPCAKPRKGFWDVWERELPNEVKHYETIIYPQIIDTLQKIYTLNPHQKLDIIDLGGGSGKLADTILKKLPQQVRQVVVIDSSAPLIGLAKKRAKKHSRKLVARCIGVEEISEKLYASPQYKQSADVAILCGVVAHQVLNKKAALDIIEKCKSILRENGMIIATSLSAALINSTEYEQMGYHVLNKTFSFTLDRGPRLPSTATNDFYILQKKSSSDT